MFEALEPRSYRSSTFVLIGHTLSVAGTSRADSISIAAGKAAFIVYVNAEQESFATSRIKLIRISGGSGNDSIIVSPNLNIPCAIEGGPGNDRIGGGAGNDTIFGESGNDTLVGNGGDDYLSGDDGNDLLEDASELNALHGGPGNDVAITEAYDVTYYSGIETLKTFGPNVTFDSYLQAFDRHGQTILEFTGIKDDDEQYTLHGPATVAGGHSYMRFTDTQLPSGIDFGETELIANATGSETTGLDIKTNLLNDDGIGSHFSTFTFLLPGWTPDL